MTPRRTEAVTERSWRRELSEGVRWLWHHELLRTMAIILGLFNAAASITFSVYVLFAQEVLGASTAEFAVIMMAGAAGAIVGGWTASWLSKRLGCGTFAGGRPGRQRDHRVDHRADVERSGGRRHESPRRHASPCCGT